MNQATASSGFMALVAVLLLSAGSIAFALSTLASVVFFADSVRTRELRIQTRLNVEACLDTLGLMAAKDYFLQGTVMVPELGCVAEVHNDLDGNLSAEAVSGLSGVTATDSRSFILSF
jgi:hypothetical protein